jgi:hypothetical protein
VFFTLLVLTAAAGAARTADNPLAPAMAGLLECMRPDDQKKTCLSIASYRLVEGSTYSSTGVIVISASGPLILETVSPATVNAGSVCGVMKSEDLSSGRIRMAGKLLTHAQAAPILARTATSLSGMMNKEICVTYERSGEGLVAKIVIDGLYQADHDQVVKWVEPDAGYVVVP